MPMIWFETLKGVEQTEAVQGLLKTLQHISRRGLSGFIFDLFLNDNLPKFLYFDEYYQMRGHDNIDALKSRRDSNTLLDSDYPLLGLLALASINLDQMTSTQRTEALIAKLEAAENRLTEKVLAYWSQNRHLRMAFDIRPGQPGDPEDMTSGMNILGRVRDTKHMMSTALGTRSRGFVWFFSFLAWYSDLSQKGENLILLLDEPGLSLPREGSSRPPQLLLKRNSNLITNSFTPHIHRSWLILGILTACE